MTYIVSAIKGVIPPSEILRLDATVASSLFQDSGCSTPANAGDSVGCWEDVSGNGNDCNQSNGARKPKLEANIFGSLPGVLGDDSNTGQLLFANNSLISGTSNMTFIVSVKTGASFISNEQLLGFGSGFDAARPQLQVTVGGGMGIFHSDAGGGSTSTVTLSINTIYILLWRINSSGLFVSNGISTDTIAQVGYDSFVDPNRVLFHAGGSEGWNAHMGEVRLFDRELNNPEVNRAANVMATKWGASWNNL